MIVVSNTSPLIFFSKINKLDLLKRFYKKVNIPQAVFDEINSKKSEYTDYFNKSGIYRIHKLTKIKSFNLGGGEQEAIGLAILLKADLVLIDDRKARSIIESLNIKCIGTIGFLLLSLKKRLINYEEFKILLDKLIECGFRIDINIYTKVLEESEKFE